MFSKMILSSSWIHNQIIFSSLFVVRFSHVTELSPLEPEWHCIIISRPHPENLPYVIHQLPPQLTSTNYDKSKQEKKMFNFKCHLFLFFSENYLFLTFIHFSIGLLVFFLRKNKIFLRKNRLFFVEYIYIYTLYIHDIYIEYINIYKCTS